MARGGVFFILYLILGLYFINFGFNFIKIPAFFLTIDKWIIFVGGVFLIIGGINLIFTLLAMTLIDRFGRKLLIIFGTTGMMMMLTGLSVLYFINQTSGILVLIFILGYCAFFSASLGPTVWVMVAELFPNRLRSKGMSVAVIALWIACTIVTIAFPIMLEKLSGGITFMIFALICLANLLYVLKYVPETKGRTLEQLEKELGDRGVDI